MLPDAPLGSGEGFWCKLALRLSEFWDWVDRRQIDAHAISALTMFGTIKLSLWAMAFAEHSNRPGLEVAAIIAAIGTPWAALQAAVIKFVFDARTESFK